MDHFPSNRPEGSRQAVAAPRPHAMQNDSERHGFTLVELLVVIAITAVLVAVLLPVLGTARETGNRVKCAAQLRQWGQALNIYANDFGEQYPGTHMWGNNDMFNRRSGNWSDGSSKVDYSTRTLPEYGFSNRQMLECPSRTTRRHAQSNLENVGYWASADYWAWFGRADHPNRKDHNGWIYWSPKNAHGPIPRRDLPHKSVKAIMAMDRAWIPANQNKWYFYGPEGWSTSNHQSRGGGAIRDAFFASGSNALILDGSVHWMNLTQDVYYYGKDYYHRFYVDEFHKP